MDTMDTRDTKTHAPDGNKMDEFFIQNTHAEDDKLLEQIKNNIDSFKDKTLYIPAAMAITIEKIYVYNFNDIHDLTVKELLDRFEKGFKHIIKDKDCPI